MNYCFVTPSGSLQDSWQAAFPQAVAITRAADIALDAATPGVTWVDAAACRGVGGMRELREVVALGRPVVVMADSPEETEALRMLNAGAVGYCLRACGPGEFREIALVVEHGGLWIAPELKNNLLALSNALRSSRRRSSADLGELTSRELMVAEQVARGATNREIACILAITERTVKAHLSAVFEKLGVRDRVQLALTMNNLPCQTIVS